MSLIMLGGGPGVFSARLARRGRVIAACVVVGLAVPAPAGAATASAPGIAKAPGTASPAGTPSALGTARPAGVADIAPGRKLISYLGYAFKVPASWPVINDTAHPRSCVRFDIHAVYLGVPGVNQDCPSWLVGTTEAVLIQPGPAHAPRTSAENATSRQITVTAPRISLAATYDTSPAQIDRILASASLPAPVIKVPDRPQPAISGRTVPGGHAPAGRAPAGRAPAGRAGARAQAARAREPGAGHPRRRRPLPAGVTNFRGRGFDACAAPSRAYMRAWRRSSRYRAVGIYIGGADRACDQRNLTAGWVRHEARAGWHFIPMYVGPQAAFREITSPIRQARRAAADAVVRARRLGFGPRTPIYYDMEAFRPRQTRRVLRFLSAWTARLHARGYLSGVYSSSTSGIMELARKYSRRAYTMPDVVFDALWNGSPNTADRVYRSDEWSNHQRLHQYNGNVTQTHGHDTINIDQDYLNVELPEPGGTFRASPAVSRRGGRVEAFFEGADHRLWRATRSARSGWARLADMGGSVGSVPSVVYTAPRALDAFYRGRHRRLWEVSFRPGRGWGPARRIAMLGILGGAPRAVTQAGGVVDIFWKGSADRHLWYGQFTPGRGWKGPRSLGGALASNPSPVESSPGTIQVFWKGTDRSLWHVSRGLSGRWTGPARLGMGPLGGAPQATAQVSGMIEVFWKGTGQHRLWTAWRGSRGWRGPRDLGGHVTDAPWPVTAGGKVRVLWRGPGGSLWQTHRTRRGRWRRPVRLRAGGLRSGPFAATGPANGALQLFWKGRGGHLLWAAMAPSGTWTRARNLGGHVA